MKKTVATLGIACGVGLLLFGDTLAGLTNVEAFRNGSTVNVAAGTACILLGLLRLRGG